MKSIIAVFAHPDDEAFGPSGTLALLSKEFDVYLVCVTRGNAGKNSLEETVKLGHARKRELLASAKILGIKSVYFLGFGDGCVCNRNYHKIAERLAEIAQGIKPEMFVTFEPRGVSGHLDHIGVSFITSFVFERHCDAKILLQYCLPDDREVDEDYFVYFPKGYRREEIDLEVDIGRVWNIKMACFDAHKSQKHDAAKIKKEIKDMPKKEYFLLTTKPGFKLPSFLTPTR